MIPILFESTETTFLNNGIGRLADAISCVVTEERNGMYELEMDYPQSGIHYEDIQLFRLIYAIPADGKSGQPFEIYDISKPLNGVITVRAWHISYRLNNIVVEPFTAASCAAAFVSLKGHSINTNPFNFNTDKNITTTFTVDQPASVRSLLGGQAGSILDVYGKGEYEWDKFDVYFRTNRGSDRGVTIRYGKNLTELTADASMETVYTGIVPYYFQDDVLVMLSEQVLWSDHRTDYTHDLLKAVDLTSYWPEVVPTENQLRTAAQAYLVNNEGWELNTNLRLSFIALSDTEEYKDVATLQRVNLCDTVTITHEELGVSAKAKVITTVYNTLLERYDEIELGDTTTNLGQAITASIPGEIADAIRNLPTISVMEDAISNGTALISGNAGGYIKIKTNANGKPQQILIMNTADESTATNIWRWNSSGIGYSSDGGTTYKQAWTIDGRFYTDWVTAGSINAALVNTGTITSYDGKVQIVLGDANTAGKLIINSGNLRLDQNGNLTITGTVNASAGNIGGWTITADRLVSLFQPTSTIPGYRIDLLVPNAGDPPTDIGTNSAILVRTHEASGSPNWGDSDNVTTTFRLRYDGALLATNANVTGTITANNGRLGGAGGLVIKEGYGYYTGSHNSYDSGNRGMYCGIDGMSFGQVDLGGGHKFPLIQFDYGENATGGGRVYVFRLDFVKETSSSPYWTPAHSFVVDDRMRITTGAGMNIGNGGYNTSGGEYDTTIGGTLYANVQGGSDIRIKKNVRELSEEESVNFIMNCKPVMFEFANENYPKGIHHGLIAQDVQKIAGDWSVVGGSEDSIYALGYTEMVADLIKVAQNQERRIADLEARLAALEGNT